MELGREGDLEQHVLHHVMAERLGQLDVVALEQHVLELDVVGEARQDLLAVTLAEPSRYVLNRYVWGPRRVTGTPGPFRRSCA
jgi:hypothetical protein